METIITNITEVVVSEVDSIYLCVECHESFLCTSEEYENMNDILGKCRSCYSKGEMVNGLGFDSPGYYQILKKEGKIK